MATPSTLSQINLTTTNKLVSASDLSNIKDAINRRVLRFKTDLEAAVNESVDEVKIDSLDYVGSRIGGPDPKIIPIAKQIDNIISSIDMWGEE